MSTAPKTGGMDNRIVLGLIALAVVVLLMCGGVFFFFIVKSMDLFGSPGAGGGKGKAVSTEDGLKAAEAFVKDLREEEYGHALKYRSTARFRGKYNADALKEWVEKDGKGVIGATNWRFLQVGQTPDSVKFVGQMGGGPNGAVRVEMTIVDEGEGPRVSELKFAKE